MSSPEQKPGRLRRIGSGISTVFGFIYKAMFVLSLVLGLVIAWLIWSGGPTPSVEDNVGLVVAPTGALVEHVDIDPVQEAFRQFSGEPPRQTAVADIVTTLKRARDDDRIPFVVLKVDGVTSAGLGAVEEVAQAVADFRSSGKPAYVWADMLTQTQYLLAAQADDIALDPMGGVWLEGFSVYPNYFADLLDKLGLRVNVFRVGDFKSAVEPFIRNDMSDEARADTAVWLESLWQGYRRQASAVRESTGEVLPSYIEGLPDALEAANGDLAGLLLDAGLVDRVESLQDFRERLGAIAGMDTDGHGSFRQINHRRYLRATRDMRVARRDAPVVEQITVQGVIVDGMGDIGTAGGEFIARQLDAARADDEVRAVVLRIDSPGGSVLASERIRSSVKALRDAGKPVVASMASQAASGGYWIAMDSDEIIAHASTITGSIGVFGLWLGLDETLSRIGVHTDGVGTTPLAGSLRPDRPLDPSMRRIFQAGVERAYALFIEGVAEARGMPIEAVEAVAGGRVFSGTQAQQNGLLDSIGGLSAAADRAAELAGLDVDDYQLRKPQYSAPGLFGTLRQFSGRVSGWLDGNLLSDLIGRWAQRHVLSGEAAALPPAWWSDPQGRYALCECLLQPDRVPSGGQLRAYQEIR